MYSNAQRVFSMHMKPIVPRHNVKAICSLSPTLLDFSPDFFPPSRRRRSRLNIRIVP